MISHRIFILFLCLWINAAAGACHSRFISEKVCKEISLYLMPEDHPVKKTLDEIVKEADYPVFYDMKSMVHAGFDYVLPQHKTKIIVTRHPKLKGYVIKAYLDTQEYYEELPEHYYFIKRVQGANLIRKAIKKRKVSHLLKVPRKWIYQLPDSPYKTPPSGLKKKMFILVEDDMDILDDEASKARWSSPFATKELISALHSIITEYRFKDCAKPANCPFCKDGRVALVDTQSFYKRKVGYYKLTPYLSSEMADFWKSLSHVAVKGN